VSDNASPRSYRSTVDSESKRGGSNCGGAMTQYAGVCSINISQKSIQVDMLGDTGGRKHGLTGENCQD
jgi:hypothetical protein